MTARPLRVLSLVALLAPASARARAPAPSAQPAEATVKTVEFEAPSVGRTMNSVSGGHLPPSDPRN